MSPDIEHELDLKPLAGRLDVDNRRIAMSYACDLTFTLHALSLHHRREMSSGNV
jgi:hypothetical protein